jgi:AraC family transcriptional regulator of adaptative response / DNA-3-methyladenine glycosylase II
MFDLNADWLDIAQTLGADPVLATRLNAAPGLRVPGSWDGFELATRAILGQQITVRGATTLAGRIVNMFGRSIATGEGLTHVFPTAELLAQADLMRAGLTRARAATIRALAQAVCEKRICFGEILDSQHFLASLREIPGIGTWTAQYIAMRALGEPDAFPSGDIALVRALGLSDLRELEARAEVWRPWRAYAAIYLWTVGGEQKANTKPLRLEKKAGSRSRGFAAAM